MREAQHGFERWASGFRVMVLTTGPMASWWRCLVYTGPGHWAPKEQRKKVYCSGSSKATLPPCLSRASSTHLWSILSCSRFKVLFFKDVIRAQKKSTNWKIFWMWSACWAGDSLGPHAPRVWSPPRARLWPWVPHCTFSFRSVGGWKLGWYPANPTLNFSTNTKYLLHGF